MGEDAGDLATLLARLESALARGETAAMQLQALGDRHMRLQQESRAAVETLDRLIAACG